MGPDDVRAPSGCQGDLSYTPAALRKDRDGFEIQKLSDNTDVRRRPESNEKCIVVR